MAIVIKDVTVTAIAKTLNFDDMTPEEAKAFLRKVMGPPKRVLEGDESEHMLTVFRLLEPTGSSNNQRSFTEEYEHAGKKYDVHYFEGEVIVEEILPDDFQ
jgi:hypothetical protein